MRRFRFSIEGDFPPKKDGSQSMWGKHVESVRLVKLRQSASKSLGNDLPLQSNIKLTLEVHVGPMNERVTGDLDNYITGVCDGLMKAAPNSKFASLWDEEKLKDIHPSEVVAMVDDSQVLCIRVEKVIDESKHP